jgi:hypothetical protein
MTDLTSLALARRWRLTRPPFDGSALGDPIVQGKRGSLWASLAGIRPRRSASAADHLRRFAFGTPTEATSGPTTGAGGAARPGQASTEREPAP